MEYSHKKPPSCNRSTNMSDDQAKHKRYVVKGHSMDYDAEDMSFGAKWHRFIFNNVHTPILRVLVTIARASAMNPKRVIVGAIVLSIASIITGIMTNFNVDVNEDVLWSPKGSRSLSHYDWIHDHSDFPPTPRYWYINVHSNGDNVLSQEGMARVFEALDTVRQTPGYHELCEHGDVLLPNGTMTCFIKSPTRFWNYSVAIFEAQVQSDEDAIAVLSQPFYPDGTPVDHEAIMGNPVFGDNGLLTSATMLLTEMYIPGVDDNEAEDFEEEGLDRLLDLQESWEAEAGNPYRFETLAERSFADEFTRAIIKDIPLVPAVFTIMSIFTAAVFWKRDKVYSRTLLGFGAVVTVLLSIMTGYGLLFMCGVNFTSMTQILPFIMFGIGLDAAFILSGSFSRTDPKTEIVERIELMVRDVGVSITVTTMTSSFAFALGCMSSIPSVDWLCLYAFPTIIIDFIYQMTFFIAILALDEKRIMENRRDVCICLTVEKEKELEGDVQGPEGTLEGEDEREAEEAHSSMTDGFMLWYADKLLHPVVRVLVILAFTGLVAGCAYSASLMTQEFDFTTIIPDDSYITPFVDTRNDYTSRGGAIVDVYFRYEDQSSIGIREEMDSYINDLVELKQIDQGPAFFWLRDFNQFVEDNPGLQDLEFYDQFDVFIGNPTYNAIYGDHIVLDENGHITASKTKLYMNNIDIDLVKDLIAALEDQRRVSSEQPVNKGQEHFSFFTFSDLYLIWEFYAVAVEEMIMSTVLGIVAVCLLAVITMPHWTAVFFVAPFMCILYVDLLGILQFAGIHVNSVSYISLVMSIGLLVDFIVHILLRYYEVRGDRVTRTKELLRTMGSSVLLGGISTFLGVIPLAFSTSTIFNTIFVTFMGLVTLGVGHGLILLPVVLSILGPEGSMDGRK